MKKKRNFLKLIMIMMALTALVAFGATPALCGNFDSDGDEIAGDIEKPLPDWGTLNYVTYSMAPFQFNGYNAANDNMINGYGFNRYCTANCNLNDAPHLPTGARIYGFELDYYDGGSGSVGMAIGYCPYNASGCTLISSAVYSATTSGYGYITRIGLNHTVDNFNNSYLVDIYLSGGGSLHRLVGAHVFYYLQVSPSPGSATFWDVPTYHPFFRYIEALARSGITSGTGGGAYSPDAAVTRGQMAVFLSKALGLHYPY